MKPLFTIFQKLKSESPNVGEGFAIASIPNIKNHKIGITLDRQPIFFINCESNPQIRTIDTKLEFISVQFNRQCQLINQKGKSKEGLYTIISLKSDTKYLEEYFLKIVHVLLNSISEKPLLKDLKIEIDNLINLFSKFSKPPLKTIQGLWAELLVIQLAKKPDYMIQCWHSATSDKYDFNDGVDKVEVKSTSTNNRVHNFSLEQLRPNVSSKLFIVSVFTLETGTGYSVFDLIDMIEKKTGDIKLILRLNELTVLTLGKDFEKAQDVFFDYQFAVDSLKFYNSIDIPTIAANNIPSNVSNVRFDCDISNIKAIRNDSVKSKLLNSLF